MTWPPSVSHVAVLGVAVAAAVYDLRTRRLPNALTLGAAGLALALQFTLAGWHGVAVSAAGWILGLVLFFPFYALGGMGAGDVKLLAAFGAWLGPAGVLWTGLYGAVAGGVLALGVSMSRGYTITALRNVVVLLRSWFLGGVRPVEGMTLASSAGPRLPYAVPLAAGAVVALWMH